MTSEREYTKQTKRNMRMMVCIQQILAYDHVTYLLETKHARMKINDCLVSSTNSEVVDRKIAPLRNTPIRLEYKK